MEKKYEIGGKTYIQRPLVLGQVKQLRALLTGIEIPVGGGAAQLLDLLDRHVPAALAIVLTEEGESVRDKDRAGLSAELEFSITPETALEVVEDFFTCNPLQSLLSRLSGAAVFLGATMAENPEKKSTGSASSSPAETSPGETPSSGA